MADEFREPRPGSEYLYEALVAADVDLLVGVPGTQTLPLDRTVAERDDVRYVMARHETAIPHVAWGYYEASRRMAATITVPGPGETNAAHGLKNALDDGVPMIHVSPVPDPETVGRHPIHELDGETFDHVVKENLVVERPRRLRETVDRAVETALSAPTGPVRLAIPKGFLADPVPAPPASYEVERTAYDPSAALDAAVDLLEDAQRPLLYVGGGARRSRDGPAVVADLADRLDAPVAVSYKGKGVFPEDSDRFLAVTGGDMPAAAEAVFEAADVVLALGTNFDGPNTANWSLPMGKSLIHVDHDPSEIGRSYETAVGVVADVTDAGRSLLDQLHDENSESWDGAALATDVRDAYAAHLESVGLYDQGPPVPSPALLAAVRAVAPRETIVTTDIGGHRIWSKNCFETYEREGVITAGSWAGMGVGLPSAIGAKLARPETPVLALTGDGSLFMCAQELHTAAVYDLDLAVVLFNDADYGVISKQLSEGPNSGRRQFAWPSPDWVALAEAYDCAARSAETADEVRAATEWALGTDGPALVDVTVDPNEPSPYEAAAYDAAFDPSEY